ncbi:MAG TPA: hypothetical protein VFI93_02000, partial [Rhizomicrobium sp.]|nr:hypothetical protein [Rhizomicrobium sp.]
ERLMAEREIIYAEADLKVQSEDGPHNTTVEEILNALKERGLWSGSGASPESGQRSGPRSDDE